MLKKDSRTPCKGKSRVLSVEIDSRAGDHGPLRTSSGMCRISGSDLTYTGVGRRSQGRFEYQLEGEEAGPALRRSIS